MTDGEILDLPLSENDAGAATIKDYLKKLLKAIWCRKERFSGKRPFGNGGWEFDVYKTLIKNNLVAGGLDEDGYLEYVDSNAADEIIIGLINSL